MNKNSTMRLPALRHGLKIALTATLLWAGHASAQSILLLDPAGDGGFENGNSFAANGWTVENYTSNNANKWFVGNAGMPTAGNNAAYISGDAAGAAYSYDTAASSRVMFWRDITFPQGYTAVTLSFKVKAGGEKGSGNNEYYDDLSVHFQNSNTVPPVAQPAMTVTQATLPNASRTGTIVNTGGSYVNRTYYLDAGNATAATTRRLIFYWKNNDSLGMQPPPAIDEISVSVAMPPANDDADSAIMLTLGAGCTGATHSNIGATSNTSEPSIECRGPAAAFKSVWYKFLAPASGAVKVSCDNGGTAGDTRMALFNVADSADYTTFNILFCDDDNGVVKSDRSLFYATGLTAGTTYYIVLDVWSYAQPGTFCISVDEMDSTMLSITPGDCAAATGINRNAAYRGWMSLVDDEGRLNANYRHIDRSTTADGQSVLARRTVKSGALRQDGSDGVSYLNRNYFLSGENTDSSDVQLFFTDAELAATGGGIAMLNVTMSGSNCNADFTDRSEKILLTQTGNGSANGVNWIQVNTPGLSNFYIHKGNRTLSVETPAFKSERLRVSPNPANGLLSIYLFEQPGPDSYLQMVDILGKVVYRTQPSRENITIDISSLAAGQYYLRYANTGGSNTVKIIKN